MSLFEGYEKIKNVQAEPEKLFQLSPTHFLQESLNDGSDRQYPGNQRVYDDSLLKNPYQDLRFSDLKVKPYKPD